MDHPTHYHAQGKDTGPASRRVPQRTQHGGHTPIQRRRPTNIQYEAQKPNTNAEPSDACPAAPRPEVRAATHSTTAPTPQHTIQRRTECSKEHPEQKLHTKLTLRKCTPTSPPKTKSPVKAHPHEKKIRSIQVPEHARHPYPCQKQPRKEAHPEAHMYMFKC
ncbi:hypothetical protein CRENBAI_021136 [Crenichthys baileyi]|uniref:Uncharacterized protein n=1 Tax=Crenichthys baileyi TaxID=28760 RepID=A0AAV9R9F5_9TELE